MTTSDSRVRRAPRGAADAQGFSEDTAGIRVPAPPKSGAGVKVLALAARNPFFGPLAALLVLVVIFSFTTSTFLSAQNFSVILQQSVVIGTLALGQTLIILTAGIDLANGAILVVGALVMAKLAQGQPAGMQILILLCGFLLCGLLAFLSGLLVARFLLPAFIVTLGMYTMLTAGARLYSQQTLVVPQGILTVLGTGGYLFGVFQITVGVFVVIAAVLVLHFALTRTAWGRHVYAVGGNPTAARRTGINVRRVLLVVYLVAGLLYGLAAWQAFGRSPATSANVFGTANLDTISAVVIGGTSLFGGRGTVIGSYFGTLIVLVLQSGLTQMGLDPLYQQVLTGALVIGAVALDQFTRKVERLA
ncbi:MULTISPECIES: ABC transporter permease [unclassified Microbacterium]|uniref:ABC transporter permease n=1 Tax=unclassified Microbacterium TaxID=2609290 RepID=UPI001AD3831D|nr:MULTISPECIES: ABC transporter permease [unclassified Microbacterium]MBN9158432.1 ABC transporter permease [Microbacterium sp.]